jgi:hypothetical protein
LRDDTLAAHAAGWAADVAARRQENRERWLADAIVDSLRRPLPAPSVATPAGPISPEGGELVDALVASLEAGRAAHA